MCDCCAHHNTVLTPEIKEVVGQAPFIPIATVSGDGQPHLIVAGKVKEIRGDNTIVFGVYKMEKTRRNIAESGLMQVAAVSGKKGYRLSGRASVEGEEVLLTVYTAESLL
ncbi:MAG: pyridoxamine 5-phosphate oxidase [Peptococcaceae bacterium BICA1-7]|nr:MAG: pyridoxamine 5-phosphate oxidase [Peptococcaceae bacterium BICA1-7]HBV98215.1 pyridoxamine 5'-phosphate oxidase family protein [Desulfotomaculum sp.]